MTKKIPHPLVKPITSPLINPPNLVDQNWSFPVTASPYVRRIILFSKEELATMVSTWISDCFWFPQKVVGSI